MATKLDSVRVDGWVRSLEDLDREVGRLAMLCRVRILEPGVIDRVLANDRSVCGDDNAMAFTKLRNLLMMHFAVHGKRATEVGEAETAAIERIVLDRLRASMPELLADLPKD